MIFSSCEFLFLFLPLCILLYFNPLIKNIKYKNIVLLIFSLIFYSFGSFKYLWVLLLSIIFNYLIGIFLSKSKNGKVILTFGILINVILLFYFKVNASIVPFDNYNLLPIIGPLGISFFTFQQISYLVDIYRDVIPVQKNLVNYSLYVSFFPQLIAGPIIRYSDIYESLSDRKTTKGDIDIGIYNFIIGLFKKSVIADTLGKVTINIFHEYGISYCTVWLGAIVIALQLYYDFSGYSNMAIGLGRVFGFKFNKNFDYPYASFSVNEYWKRWNISLGKWINDYLLYPICNSKFYIRGIDFLSTKINKKSALKLCNLIALLICWLFVGLWHGIGLNYLYLGLYYFVFLVLEKNFRYTKKENLLSNIYTLFVVIIGTVLFFSFYDKKFVFLKSMFINDKLIDGRFFLIIKNYYLYIFIAIIFCFPVLDKIKKGIKQKSKTLYSIISSISLLLLFCISVYFIIVNDKTTFLYFNF